MAKKAVSSKNKKKKAKRKLRPGHNRTPKSATQKSMSFNLRAFPTELVWKMRKRSAELQMTMKEFVIQEMTKATAVAPESDIKIAVNLPAGTTMEKVAMDAAKKKVKNVGTGV